MLSWLLIVYIMQTVFGHKHLTGTRQTVLRYAEGRHMKTLKLSTFMILLLFCLPQTTLPNGLPPKDKLCPKNDCRGPITIKLIREDGTTFEQMHEYLYPIVQSMGITILAGEHVEITGDFENNKLINIRALTKTDKDLPLITFNFEQKDGKMMLLTVVNHYKHDIKYHLSMMPLKEEKLFKTSSCPVLAGKMAFESWPFPIYQLLIPEIFIIETKHNIKCEY